MVQKLGQSSRLPTALEPQLLRFSAADAYGPEPFWQIFDSAVWHANYHDGAAFKDKIVMIGAASQVAHDFVTSPFSSSMSGPVLHLNAIAAGLAGEFLQPDSSLVALRPGLCGGSDGLGPDCICTSIAHLFGLVRRGRIALFDCSTGGFRSERLFAHDGAGAGAFLASGVSSLGWEYVLERREKLKTRRTLERYVSKNLVKDILDNPESFYSSMKGARIPVSVLFTDLIGFTTLSERADPEELVRQLNEYLSKMVSVVFQNRRHPR